MFYVFLTSSISSNIGCLSAIRSIGTTPSKTIVLGFPPKSTGKEILDLQIQLFRKNNINTIFFYNYFVKVAVFLILKILSSFPGVITIFEPRPKWSYSLLSSVFAMRIKAMRNKILSRRQGGRTAVLITNYSIRNFYGDGLGLYCSGIKPWWLATDNEALDSYAGNYHYIFKLETEVYNSIFLNKISDSVFTAVLEDALLIFGQHLESIIAESEKSIFLAGSTFSKTNRCSIDEEAKLYLEYLERLKVECTEYNVIFKPHPNCFPELIANFTRLAAERGITVQVVYDFWIPIELIFCAMKKAHGSCVVAGTTTGVTLAAMQFQLEVWPAFGEMLIEKYLAEDFKSSRLEQEQIISELIRG